MDSFKGMPRSGYSSALLGLTPSPVSTKIIFMRRDQILQFLREHAISNSLFPPTTLKSAIHRMGFIQADPIRSPARAHDLILRHRVKGYRAGDLERNYASLDIEEDVLYAYGFLPRTIWRLLHPRNSTGLSSLEKKVLDTVGKFGVMHPREMEAHFGRKRVINNWGGYSKATTRALEALHYRGLLRIAKRENGIRLYEAARPSAEILPEADRLRELILAIAGILSPVPQRTLQANVARYRRLGNPRSTLTDLIHEEKLRHHTIDGITYLFPPLTVQKTASPRVRFLAPFDPLVWDRLRFEHFWGWPYRFEAYTPPAKRVRGYYAMPLLWNSQVIGWANAQVSAGSLNVEVGFVDKRPQNGAFDEELEKEMMRLKSFLGLTPTAS